MALLRLIGYWIRSLDDDEFPPPQELVAEWEPELRAKVICHLASGTVLSHFRGLSWCRFFCGESMGCRELTDGQWVWPEDLVHYVRDHNVRLPDEFIQSVCDGAGCIDVPGRPVVDKSYWKSWSAKHRSQSLRSRILPARAKAMIESERLKKLTAQKIERKEGVSDSPCQGRGCTSLALRHRKNCARCLIDDEDDLYCEIREPFYNMEPVLADS